MQGPCGEEWDDDYDGDMTSKPLWGFPNADGISVACADTVVERNVRLYSPASALFQWRTKGCDRSRADPRLYSILPMELLSFSVRPVVRFEITTSFPGRESSSEVSLISLCTSELTIRNQSGRLRPLQRRFHKRPSPPQYPPCSLLLPESRNSSRPLILVR